MDLGAETALEASAVDLIKIAIGAQPDVLLLRNQVGFVKYFDERGKPRGVRYGLQPGSPDFVCMLTVEGVATWFCLEAKRSGEDSTDEQKKVANVWRRFGAYVGQATNGAEALQQLELARRQARERMKGTRR